MQNLLQNSLKVALYGIVTFAAAIVAFLAGSQSERGLGLFDAKSTVAHADYVDPGCEVGTEGSGGCEGSGDGGGTSSCCCW